MARPDTARRRAVQEAKSRLRDLRIELAVLNHHVGTRVELRDADLEVLDVIVRDGPLSPTALARRTGLHSATLTGILNRLEAEGWITRERSARDRRAVVVRAEPGRVREIFGAYEGMNDELDAILAGYSAAELALISDFLHRSTEAGRRAGEQLLGTADDRPVGRR